MNCRKNHPVLLLTLGCLLAVAWSPPARAGASADAQVALAYGLKALHAGDGATAVRELEEAARLAPEDGTTLYFLGLARLGTGDAGQAAEAFEAALAAKRPPRVERERIEADLARARDRVSGGVVEELLPVPELLLVAREVVGEKPRPLSGNVGVSIGTDSNPALLADGATFFSDGRLIEKSSDTVLAGDFRLAWTPLHGEEAGPFGITVSGGISRHDDFDFLDLESGRAVVHYAVKGSPAGYAVGPLGFARTPVGEGGFFLLLQGGVGYTRVDGKSALRSGEAGATLGYRRASWGTQVEVLYRDLSYTDDRSDDFRQSGDELTLGLAQTFFFGNENRFLKLSAAVGERDGGAALDADRLIVGGNLVWAFTSRVSFQAGAGWRREEFQNPESNPYGPFVSSTDPREDTGTWASGALSFALTPHLLLTARGSWAERDAEVDLVDLDYDRTTAALAVTWIF